MVITDLFTNAPIRVKLNYMIKKKLIRQDYRLTDSKDRTIDIVITEKHLEIAKVDGHKNNFTFMSTKSPKTIERWQGVIKLLAEAVKLMGEQVK